MVAGLEQTSEDLKELRFSPEELERPPAGAVAVG
jgi:hypothetical protein